MRGLHKDTFKLNKWIRTRNDWIVPILCQLFVCFGFFVTGLKLWCGWIYCSKDRIDAKNLVFFYSCDFESSEEVQSSFMKEKFLYKTFNWMNENIRNSLKQSSEKKTSKEMKKLLITLWNVMKLCAFLTVANFQCIISMSYV